MKLVKPGEESQPQGKPIRMTTVIPGHEEPVIWLMLVACKSGGVYVGTKPGQERSSFQLCLKGAETLHTLATRELAEYKTAQVQPVHTDLGNIHLPPMPGRLS